MTVVTRSGASPSTRIASERTASESTRMCAAASTPRANVCSYRFTRSAGCHCGNRMTDRSWTVTTVGSGTRNGTRFGSWYRSNRPKRAMVWKWAE